MIKWWKERSRQEKWMIVIIVILLVGVIVRWGYVTSEAGEAFRQRIDHFKPQSNKE